MDPSRRTVMTAGLGVGITTVAGATVNAGSRARPRDVGARHQAQYQAWVALKAGSTADQSQQLQHIIDTHAQHNLPVYLPPGTFRVADIILRTGTKLIGAHGLTQLQFVGGSTFVHAENVVDILLQGLGFDGQNLALDAHRSDALLKFENCSNIEINACLVNHSLLNGLTLQGCSGRVQNTTVEEVRSTALLARDSTGLDIVHNTVRRCGDNAIQVWRSTPGPDGTRISANRIEQVAAKSGGSGQYGNGINVFRAGNVSVTDNHISDCAYSAVRGNAASNLQILSNSVAHIGEVALYAEFEFEGAMISNNMISDAATGISVTNFNQGGRLAAITGNLIRNLKRREHETVDKRGVGISVEADSVVSNNIIENAPSAGLALGYGAYRRDLIASQNLIRNAKVGILVSSDPVGGATLITGNLISGATAGAIRHAHLDLPFGPELANGTDTKNGLSISQNVIKNAAE